MQNIDSLVTADELSKLPPMYDGKVWTLNQSNDEWNNRLVKCIGIRKKGEIKYPHEQIVMQTDGVGLEELNEGSFGEDNKLRKDCFVAICIDTRYWTGVIEGEKVRVYEDSEGSIIIKNAPMKSGYVWATGLKHTFTDRVWLSAIKRAGIPIMPYSQRKGNFESPK